MFAYHEYREHAGISEDKEYLEDNTKSNSFVYQRILFGDTLFVAKFFDKNVSNTYKEFAILDDHLDQAVLVKNQIPIVQILWPCTLRCRQDQCTLQTCHLDPRITQSCATPVDPFIFSFVSK